MIEMIIIKAFNYNSISKLLDSLADQAHISHKRSDTCSQTAYLILITGELQI